jgi:hypothetical protein
MSFLDRLLITQQVPHVDLNLINASLRSTTGFEQVTVVNVREEKLGGINKFNAHLFRLYLTYDPPSADAPQTIIAKLPAIDPELHERAVTFQPGVRENWFYRLGASRSPIHVPRCYYNATDQTTNQSVLLLEDLAPFPTGNWLEGATLQQAEVALQALARLHTSWWEDGHSPEIQELTQLISANQTGEQNLVQELYNAAWPKFLAQASFAIPDEIQKFGAAIVGRMAVVDQLLTQTPKHWYMEIFG